MALDDDLFFRTSFKYHYCHPKERQRRGSSSTKTAICGWQFYWYTIASQKTLDDLEEAQVPICEACRKGYYLWLIEE